MAQAALAGPQAKLVDRLVQPLSRRLPLSADDLRALVGALLLLLAVRRIVRAVRAGRSGR
jgi:hypothetical protein